MQTVPFSQMNLSDEVMRAIEDMGFEEATHIQAASIPLILQGKDIIGQSQTGTGKTAAFSIPAIEQIRPENRKIVQVLILCPTRELALQACDEIKKFAKYKTHIHVVPIYGGQPIERQFTLLRQGAQIIVGTPGRIMDHMRRGSLNLKQLQMIVLDEADEMLSMGFREDIETILQDIPEERQTTLFSATMSREILEITKRYQTDPEHIKVAQGQLTVPKIEQIYYEVPIGKKVEVLCRLLDVYNPSRSMVFCNTKRQVDELVAALQLRGYMAGGLHGDMKQSERTQIMNSFKLGGLDVLVATDVAARGIDVENIEAVFNYDIPQDLEYYVHRIGRTGRAGREGRSFTLVCGRRQIQELRNIQAFTKAKIVQKAVPSYDEVMETKARKLVDEIKRVVAQGELERSHPIIDSLLEEHTSLDIAAAMIKMLLYKDSKEHTHQQSDDALFTAAVRSAGPHRANERGRRAPGGRMPGKRMGMPPRSHHDANMTRVALNIGRKHKVAVNHILGAVAGETGIPGNAFGRIEIEADRTLIGVPDQYVERVLSAMQDSKIMGYRTQAKKL